MPSEEERSALADYRPAVQQGPESKTEVACPPAYQQQKGRKTNQLKSEELGCIYGPPRT